MRPLILVVDDDPAVRRLGQVALEGAGYAVESAASSGEALARLAAGGVDLPVLDIVLPEIDGLEICRRVRAEHGDGYLPITSCSARWPTRRSATPASPSARTTT